MTIRRLATVLLLLTAFSATAQGAPPATSWSFAVSGDSRNCGDVVMPAIAAAVRARSVRFYWHLGDLRFIRDFDADYRQLHPHTTIAEYLADAWLDFQRNQIEPFGDLPFFLGIGNHEVLPPKTREEFLVTFADWLDAPMVREQRLRDDPHDHRLRTYYHWSMEGIDFINLDNASTEQFDAAQLQWLRELLARDGPDRGVRAVVVGMHEALPGSFAHEHGMEMSRSSRRRGAMSTRSCLHCARASRCTCSPRTRTSSWRGFSTRPTGASMAACCRDGSSVPPVRCVMRSPPMCRRADSPIQFEFHEVGRAAVPPAVVGRFGESLIRQCFEENVQD